MNKLIPILIISAFLMTGCNDSDSPSTGSESETTTATTAATADDTDTSTQTEAKSLATTSNTTVSEITTAKVQDISAAAATTKPGNSNRDLPVTNNEATEAQPEVPADTANDSAVTEPAETEIPAEVTEPQSDEEMLELPMIPV